MENQNSIDKILKIFIENSLIKDNEFLYDREERRAVENLMNKLGKFEVEYFTKIAIAVQKNTFFPIITSATELEEKIDNLRICCLRANRYKEFLSRYNK